MNLNFINKNNEVNSNLHFGLPWCRTQKNSEDEDCCGFINNSREKECAFCEIDESMVDELINDLIDCMCEVISFVMKLIKNKERKQIERKDKNVEKELDVKVNAEEACVKLLMCFNDLVAGIFGLTPKEKMELQIEETDLTLEEIAKIYYDKKKGEKVLGIKHE